MYYIELVYLDENEDELTYETILLYTEDEGEAKCKARRVFLNSGADDYQVKQDEENEKASHIQTASSSNGEFCCV